MKKIIVNADDFGISHGVNLAIQKGHNEGVINSTSLMVNQEYAQEAVKMAKNMPDLKIGLHINLTNEYPSSLAKDIPLLVDEKGKLNCGFVKLLILSFIKPHQMKQQIELEIENQIKKAQTMNVQLAHLDSHRHVHMIPLIFKIVKKMGEKYNIPRIRFINENVFHTMKTQKDMSCIWSGGVIKYAVLRVLSFWNKYKSDTYFFSILHTCRVVPECMRKIKIPSSYQKIEIMIHPGMPEVDKKDMSHVFDNNILAAERAKELQAALDKENLKGIA